MTPVGAKDLPKAAFTPSKKVARVIDVGNSHERHSRGALGVIGARSIRSDRRADRELTTSKQQVRAATDPDPLGWRVGAVRVLANALLVLLAYEVVSMAAGAAQVILTGWTPPDTPVEGVPLLVVVAVFVLVRWIYVLPGLLPVLVGLEYVARRAPHARVLTAIVAFAPMVVWELLLKSPGGFPSGQGAVLGVTAVLFAVLARLPARFRGARSAHQRAVRVGVGHETAPHPAMRT